MLRSASVALFTLSQLVSSSPSTSVWSAIHSEEYLEKIRSTDHSKALMDWVIQTPDAYVHPNLELRAFVGLFVTDDIANDEILIDIPRSLTFSVKGVQKGDRVWVEGDDDDDGKLGFVEAVVDQTASVLLDNGTRMEYNVEDVDNSGMCTVATRLLNELKLGDSSHMAPWVAYALSSPTGLLPSSWSPAGKKLLLEVIQDMPPYSSYDWITNDWYHTCAGPDGQQSVLDEVDLHAYMIALQRRYDEIFIPIFDMINHDSRDPNVKYDHVVTSSSVVVRASRNLKPGDELHTSYDFDDVCPTCYLVYGTPEIMGDFGFVSEYPQRWIFHSFDIGFSIDQIEHGSFIIDWMSEYDLPDEEGLAFMTEQIQRLTELQATVLGQENSELPYHEWQVIRTYADSAVNALQAAIDAANEDNQSLDDWDDSDAEDIVHDRLRQMHEMQMATFTRFGNNLSKQKWQIMRDYMESLETTLAALREHDEIDAESCTTESGARPTWAEEAFFHSA